MTNKINLKPIVMVAEIEYDAYRKNEEECEKCDNRFRCWTGRTLVLMVERASITRELAAIADRFTFSAKVPSCFQCGNMVGSDVTVYVSGDTNQEIKGKVLKQIITAEGTNPMEIEIEGVSTIIL